MQSALILNCSPVRNGATARIVEAVAEQLVGKFDVRRACIDDYRFGFCRGCRSCHLTARCVMDDDAARMPEIIAFCDEIS